MRRSKLLSLVLVSSGVLASLPVHAAGRLAFSGASLTVAESAGTAHLVVKRGTSSAGAVTVRYGVVAGTARNGDYLPVSGVLTWAPGDSADKTIDVPIVNDLDAEATERFSVQLSSPTGAVLGSPKSETVYVTDDDTQQIALTAANVSVAESAQQVQLTVHRSGSSGIASVNYSAANATAASGSDYVGISGVLNWADGDGADKTITVPILNDRKIENTEYFNVRLGAPKGALLGAQNAARVYIKDDDRFPDADNDGVPDPLDQCAGTRLTVTDAHGCDASQRQPSLVLPSDEIDMQSTGGKSYNIYLPSSDNGEVIAFSVFEPAVIDPAKKHALVLQGHGFAMTRGRFPSGYAPVSSSEAGYPSGSLVADMTGFVKAGFWVISIDQRGHGDSEGDVRLMDPDHEGRNLLQILDWAETHLPHLMYRDNNLVLGATGASYGGGYQLLLLSIDPKQRMDAIVPLITWNDLASSIAPNDVAKSGWAVALIAAATASTHGRVDPYIYDQLIAAAADNRVTPEFRKLLRYHSLKYFCDGNSFAGRTDEGIPYRPAVHPPKVDALFYQGTGDGIFSMNQALDSQQCLSSLGGDVRVYSALFSHASPSGIAGTGYPPFSASSCSGPDCAAVFQDYFDQFSGGSSLGSADMLGCGNYDEPSMEVLWMRAKLQRDPQAISALDSAPRNCLTLGVNRDAITLDNVAVPAPVVTTIPASSVVINAVQPVPVTMPLYNITSTTVLAGVPKAHIVIEPSVPGPVAPVDDPIIFVGLSRSRGNYDSLCHQYADPYPPAPQGFCAPVEAAEGASGTGVTLPSQLELIDDQIVPVRGYGAHDIDLNGVGERLGAGEQIQLAVYGYHYVYFASSSRDVTELPLKLSGTVQLPLFGDLPKLTRSLPVESTADADGDGVADASDNCPAVANANQADADHNGIGDACEGSSGNSGAYNVPFAPTPDADAFYAPATFAATTAPGTVLKSRTISAKPGLGIPLPNQAWQIQYVTRDVNDQPITAVATLIKPLSVPPGVASALVSYQFAYDSLGAKCTPSRTLSGDNSNYNNQAEALTYLPGLVAQGWSVVIPDYEGPYSAYGAGKLSGQATLDGIRAALSFAPLGLNANTKVGMWGYSGGALATSWAATLQPTYAPELNIAGAYAGGTPADLYGIVKSSENGPFFGLIFSAVVGANRAYPELLQGVLNDAGRAAVEGIKDACVGDSTSAGAFGNLANFTTVADPYSTPGALAVKAKVTLPQPGKNPKINMYLFHETADELIPIAGTDALVNAWCSAGVQLSYFRSATGEHVAGAASGAPSAMAYLAGRFNNVPALVVPPGAKICNQSAPLPVSQPAVTIPGYPPALPATGGAPVGGGGGGGPLPDVCDPSGFAPDGYRCLSDIPGIGPVVFGGG